jgi:hypothetical protein
MEKGSTMYYGESILFNDEKRHELGRASKEAAKGWRYRNVQRGRVRVLARIAQAVHAAENALVALWRSLIRARRWASRSLIEPR